jgi:TorA maturation chaperone TorD
MSETRDTPTPSERARAYALCAAAFAPPSPELGRFFASPRGFELFRAVLRPLGVEPQPYEARPLGERYAALFGLTARGRLSPYETALLPAGGVYHQTRELADIAGFCAAVGLALDPGEHERIDHVRCECELMAFVAYKEAYALELGDEPMLAETRALEALFLRDHLGRVAAALSRALSREDAGGFHASAAAALGALVAADCARFGVEPAPAPLHLPVAPEDPPAPPECA